MEFAPIVALFIVLWKLVDFLRYLVHKDVNGVVTQLTAWVGAIVCVFLAAGSDWAAAIPFGGQTLATINGWSLIFVGLWIGSTASIGKDILKSVDNANSSAIPTLLPAGPRDRQPNKGGVAATDVG